MWFNPATKDYTVIPDWGAKDLKPGTVRGIIKSLGLNKDDFGPVK
jgi:predicted RNA binding protein YcfA (HicA-like mRNA interferase family)